jgi:ATP-dependent exoDNAse (exonuclease V) alpha subunit
MIQKRALELLKEGNNVFLTGPAGSGKTFVLQEFIQWLKQENKDVAITASTGIAATHIEGTTIHSWAGIGIKDTLTDVDRLLMQKRPYLHERFLDTEVLIIDEVSMLDGKRLDLINEVCQLFKRSIRPFGGMQIVLCGDLFQLPPITKKGQNPDFVFYSSAWKNSELKVCYLSEQYRQSDEKLSKILAELRENSVTQSSKDILMERSNMVDDFIDYSTKLYTHNVNVDEMNQKHLHELDGRKKTFYLSAEGEEKVIEKAIKGCLAPEELDLKEGAVVMFVKNNYGKGYVNGSMGIVVGYSVAGFPIVQLKNGKEIEAVPESWSVREGEEVLSEIEQVPLRLAWAITIHKSQGMTLDAAQMDLSRCFEPGMGYVALSRLKSLDGLYLIGINDQALKINEEVLRYDASLKQDSLRNE